MTFIPARVGISAITQALPCVVTTSANHNLTTGQVVRLHVPQNYGMTNLNNNLYIVTVLSPTTFSLQYRQVPPAVNVNSLNYPAFSIPSKPQFTAEVLAVGSSATPSNNVPWQTLDNFCISDIQDATINIATTNQPF